MVANRRVDLDDRDERLLRRDARIVERAVDQRELDRDRPLAILRQRAVRRRANERERLEVELQPRQVQAGIDGLERRRDPVRQPVAGQLERCLDGRAEAVALGQTRRDVVAGDQFLELGQLDCEDVDARHALLGVAERHRDVERGGERGRRPAGQRHGGGVEGKPRGQRRAVRQRDRDLGRIGQERAVDRAE